MTAFELLFIALVLLSVLLVIGAALCRLAGRRSRSARLLLLPATAWAAYLPVVALVSAMTAPRILAMNEDLCFDDLCFRATAIRRIRAPSPGEDCRLEITVQVVNRGLGRTEGEGGLRARLWAGGWVREARAARPDQGVPLDVRLPPGGRADSVQSFDCPVPGGAGEWPDLVLDHAWSPGDLVIGESRWFHDPDRIRLSQPQ